MTDPQYIQTSKTLEDGTPNPAFYEELVETISQLCPSGKEQVIDPCMDCKEQATPMYDYKKRNWYMECVCQELPNIARETKTKAITAWNVMQSIKELG